MKCFTVGMIVHSNKVTIVLLYGSYHLILEFSFYLPWVYCNPRPRFVFLRLTGLAQQLMETNAVVSRICQVSFLIEREIKKLVYLSVDLFFSKYTFNFITNDYFTKNWLHTSQNGPRKVSLVAFLCQIMANFFFHPENPV